MTPEKIAQEASAKILIWLHGQNKLVVAIDGYTGVGKTTLSDNLVKLNPEIIAVHYDDFLISTKEATERRRKAGTDQREAVPHHNFDDIRGLVQSFRNGVDIYRTNIFNPQTQEVDQTVTYDLVGKRTLLIDGVFMFSPERLDSIWDRRIYLDGDTDEIDVRRIKREKARWGEKYFPEDHPDSHFRQVVIALKKYREVYHPEKRADVVFTVE